MSADRTSSSRARSIPVYVFLVFVVGLGVLLILTNRNPVIESVTPTVVDRSETVEITGRLFREERGNVRISGRLVPATSIISWAENRIEIAVPESMVSGLLFVETAGGSSDGWLVQMSDSVARSAGVSDRPGSPRIERLEQTEVRIGDLLTISGANFGTHRRDAEVVFPGLTDSRTVTPLPAHVSYPRWTDTSIRVRVPSGVVSGFVFIRTPWGISNPMRLVIDRPAGQMVRTNRTELAVRYSVSVSTEDITDEPGSAGSNDLVVWLPGISSNDAQSDIRYIHGDREDAVTLAAGSLFRSRFEDVAAGFAHDVDVALAVNRFGLDLEIDTSRLSPVYDGESGFFTYFTRSEPDLPGDDDRFVGVADLVHRGRASPYLIARAAYDWVLGHLTYTLGEDDTGAIAGFDRGTGDDRTYALLLTTVLRAARIPARPVAGIIANAGGDAYPHHWIEFFVPSIGWVPADPALADGGFPARFPEPDDPVEFYFGGLDSNRVTLSRGLLDNGPERRDGSHVAPEDPYSRQVRYVESGPGIGSIQATWNRPRLLAVRSW